MNPVPTDVDTTAALVTEWQHALDAANAALNAFLAFPPNTAKEAPQAATDRVHARELVQVCTERLAAAVGAHAAAEDAARPADWQQQEENERQLRMAAARQKSVDDEAAQAAEWERRHGGGISRPEMTGAQYDVNGLSV